jgi:glycosyltransferase involved in cell wall biosynthesis
MLNDSRIELIEHLVKLEAAMYSGQFKDSTDPNEIQLIYNFFISDRMNEEKLKFDPAEIAYLLEGVQFEGFLVPAFISIIDEFMGKNYFKKVWSTAFSNKEYEIYLLSVAFVGISNITGGQIIRLPKSIQKWFSEPVTIKLSLGSEILLPKLVKMLLDFDQDFISKKENELWAWFIHWVLNDSKDFFLPNWIVTELNKPYTEVIGYNESCLNRGTIICREFDHEMQKYSLSSIEDQKSLVGIFLQFYLPRFKNYRVSNWFEEKLETLSDLTPQCKEFGISNCTEILVRSHENLKTVLLDKKPFLVDQYERFILNHLKFVQSVQPKLKMAHWQTEIIQDKFKINLNQTQNSKIFLKSDKKLSGFEGLNLIGWPYAEIGIGEDVRVAALSLQISKIPFKIIDAAERLPPKTQKVDLGFSQYQTKEPVYPIDIVFLDASTQYRYYCFDAIKNKEIKRKIVGVCPWELPAWPENGKFALTNLDYFFAATRYIYNAFRPFFKEEQIFHVPPAVFIPEKELCTPVNLEQKETLCFLTIFDGYSSIHRKNPIATIKAFQRAFPLKKKDVKLIVKMMNTSLDNDVYKELSSLVALDDRIVVINKTLARSELFALVRSSDCFVSLHRSEGFGRNIAESMLLGRPVICSGFSGNLDFCKSNNSFLVEGNEISVENSLYSFSNNQSWFEPSVEHAAIHMRFVYENRKAAMDVALAGQEFIQKYHSLEAMGERYRKVLLKIT